MDLKLRSLSDGLNVAFDLEQRANGLIAEDDALATAVIVALASDRRATDDDDLPDPMADTDRRGWWGDLQAEEIWGGWPVGSRLWLLAREKITASAARKGALVARIEQYIYEALEPFITRGICSRVEVTAERYGTHEVGATIVLYRGPKPSISLQFQSLWDNVRT